MKLYLEYEPRSFTIKKSGNDKHKQFLDAKGGSIVFQTDPCKIVAIKNENIRNNKSKKLIIALDCGLDMDSWFRIIQDRIQSKFVNFRPFIEKDLLVKTNDETMGFTSKKEFLPLSKLDVGNTIICTLNTTGIWSDETSSNLVWKVKQIVKLN
jgi:hypothetical protein